MTRRMLLQTVAASRPPVKIGHRESSMRLTGDPRLFEVASRIGLRGVELQIAAGASHRLWEKATLQRYKREAFRWGVAIPSISGPFPPGETLLSAGAEDWIRRSIGAAEFLGASVILVPSFRENCPDPAQAEQFDPVAAMFQRLGPVAASAGVTLGWENSLSPAANARAIDAIGQANVRVYYDLDNMLHYGHGDQVLAGIRLLGRERICQVHVKNQADPIAKPGRVDWTAALRELRAIGYEGWYIFESAHSSEGQLVESTRANIAFLEQQLRF